MAPGVRLPALDGYWAAACAYDPEADEPSPLERSVMDEPIYRACPSPSDTRRLSPVTRAVIARRRCAHHPLYLRTPVQPAM